jgi:hypothetical protein
LLKRILPALKGFTKELMWSALIILTLFWSCPAVGCCHGFRLSCTFVHPFSSFILLSDVFTVKVSEMFLTLLWILPFLPFLDTAFS